MQLMSNLFALQLTGSDIFNAVHIGTHKTDYNSCYKGLCKARRLEDYTCFFLTMRPPDDEPDVFERRYFVHSGVNMNAR